MIDIDILKWIIVIGSAPLWMPFARALWEELNDAMRADGGLYGREPGPLQLEEIKRQLEQEEPRLVSEPLAHRKTRSTSPAGRVPSARQKGAPQQAGPQAGDRRSSFSGPGQQTHFRR